MISSLLRVAGGRSTRPHSWTPIMSRRRGTGPPWSYIMPRGRGTRPPKTSFMYWGWRPLASHLNRVKNKPLRFIKRRGKIIIFMSEREREREREREVGGERER